MIWVRAGLLAVVAGLMVLALTQTAAAPPPPAPPPPPLPTPTPRPTRVPLPTIAEMIISRVARETSTPAPRPTANSAGPAIAIVDYGFGPSQLTVQAGATVTWTNSGSEGHDVTGNGPGGTWRSGPLAPGERYQRAFFLVGTYDYVCSFHPEMRGRILVQP